MIQKNHLSTVQGLQSLKNLGFSKNFEEGFSKENIFPINQFIFYLSGLFENKIHFCVTIRKDSKNFFGIHFSPKLSMKCKTLELAKNMQIFFSLGNDKLCGTISDRKTIFCHEFYFFEVSDVEELNFIIKPFFSYYPLMWNKTSFLSFFSILNKLENLETFETEKNYKVFWSEFIKPIVFHNFLGHPDHERKKKKEFKRIQKLFEKSKAYKLGIQNHFLFLFDE